MVRSAASCLSLKLGRSVNFPTALLVLGCGGLSGTGLELQGPPQAGQLDQLAINDSATFKTGFRSVVHAYRSICWRPRPAAQQECQLPALDLHARTESQSVRAAEDSPFRSLHMSALNLLVSTAVLVHAVEDCVAGNRGGDVSSDPASFCAFPENAFTHNCSSRRRSCE